MEVIILRPDTVEMIAERTGRTVDQIWAELGSAMQRNVQVHYYFNPPEIGDTDGHI